ncbi:purine-nucleoside phosphorylase [Marinilactibacillus sp. 15R]|uniref:Purine nucleoside phosphorylase n=1 Tax=Marinilactibacillus piezotolerans TaxID=258723 RepID=A0A1I3VPP0_9LACT|nr:MULTISPECIES: purine-nucleoside phosphorylase [Marinilactibacillus]API89291.1 purine-nucleoside phosphorylase [Marinilactibacillus sp. 15R]SFJ97215.1 purine-nucleoside phosphorylase [Marinilactibacillus piezotolerans]
MNREYLDSIGKAAVYLKSKGIDKPTVGLILGSGLGELADEAANQIAIPYEEIPGFPVSTVEGHAGQLVYGELGGKMVLAMQGRFHFYEGYSLQAVTFPVRVMKALGVETLVVTNAAGGVNISFNPGDLMIITDHINFTGANPLIGKNESTLGPRFTDMTAAYDNEYQKLIKECAKESDLAIKEGVYFGLTGPTYETPAEIQMIRTLGGDAVGMSTVPEVIVANHAGLRVAGISCITNYAAGMQSNLDHAEVVEVTTRVKESFKSLVKDFVSKV